MCGCHWDDEALADCRNGDCREQAARQEAEEEAAARADRYMESRHEARVERGSEVR
jgi:hypothetical protein